MEVRIVIIFSDKPFISSALRAYKQTHTHHIFHLKIDVQVNSHSYEVYVFIRTKYCFSLLIT